jgi:hypothetical protein
VHRTWDVAQYPQWLVFEAEGQLQIRPAQYCIAKMLMDNLAQAKLDEAGAVAQLNMGEGKTRVILPMMALALGDGSNVVSSKHSMHVVLHKCMLTFAGTSGKCDAIR